jgi:DNA-binding response OmpR family regulator
MTKIMLVEDDKSLREIYGVRLLAEGYDIVSAGDGEEALAMAIKERPNLIVSDVMMPKISGFDMLDILRSTTETKNIKVIMMTALSSEEQRSRGESLGADKYLVKSQVGIEDVVRVVHEVLNDTAPKAVASAPPPQPERQAITSAPPITVPERAQAVASAPADVPVPSATQTPAVAPFTAPPAAPVAPIQPPTVDTSPKPASLKNRVIQPLSDPSVPTVDMNELLDKEIAKEAGIANSERPEVQTVAQEKQAVANEIANFDPSQPRDEGTLNEATPSEAVTVSDGSPVPPPPAPPQSSAS